MFTQRETHICSRYLDRNQHFFSQNFIEYEQVTEIPPNAKGMRVYLSCSSFNNPVHCQSWSCWQTQYNDLVCNMCINVILGVPVVGQTSQSTVHLTLWVLETITSWTKAADVQNNLGFAHWTWKASPISRWNWSSVESAAPSCPLWILKTCICIWIAYSCVYMYITHKYKELATLRVWTNYKIVKYQINVHDINYIPT